MADTTTRAGRGTMQIPRSRGAVSGLLIVALGLWGALVPFVGPLFDFAFSPDRPWAWTAGRGWLQVLPGVVAVLGGLLLFASRNRATAMIGSWMAVAAGAWFVVGRAVAAPLGLGNAGDPVAATEAHRVWLELTYFSGLGALIIFLAALAAGRLSVRSVRDIAYRDSRTQIVEEPAASDTSTWARHSGPTPVAGPDGVTQPEPVRRRRSGLFGRRRRDSRDTLAV